MFIKMHAQVHVVALCIVVIFTGRFEHGMGTAIA
jgi:hypothetical protein